MSGDTRYELPWYNDREAFGEPVNYADAERRGYTAQDYTLCHALGVAGNHDAQRVVQTAVAGTSLEHNIQFDSEHGCFFAYAATSEHMAALADVVAGLVAARNPDAQPGTIYDSPAFLG